MSVSAASRRICGVAGANDAVGRVHRPLQRRAGNRHERHKGRAVTALEYEAYGPLAIKMIGEILRTATQKWGLHIALAQHRVGRVAAGETAVVVITASAHRGEAYEANRYIIDRIKHEAPIWKCEIYADGTREWSKSC